MAWSLLASAFMLAGLASSRVSMRNSEDVQRIRATALFSHWGVIHENARAVNLPFEIPTKCLVQLSTIWFFYVTMRFYVSYWFQEWLTELVLFVQECFKFRMLCSMINNIDVFCNFNRLHKTPWDIWKNKSNLEGCTVFCFRCILFTICVFGRHLDMLCLWKILISYSCSHLFGVGCI